MTLNLLSVVLSRWGNNSDTILFNFSDLLALEITKSNYVQICQFILIRWNQTCFFHGHIYIDLQNSFDVWLVFQENVNVTYGGKNNLEIKNAVMKANQSYLKIVQSELKQYQKKCKIMFSFFFRPWKSMFEPERKRKQFFRFLFPNHI